jgi:hypothetical protein
MRWWSWSIGLLVLSIFHESLADTRHAGDAVPPAPPSTRREATDGASRRVTGFTLEKFHWDPDTFQQRHGGSLPDALASAASTSRVAEIPVAALVADLFGTVNDTQLKAALGDALQEWKRIVEKSESDRSDSDKEYLAYLERLLWAGRIVRLGMPGFEMLDDVVTPEPKYPAFEEAFKEAFARVQKANREFHELVDRINKSSDPEERKRLQKELGERYGAITKFLDGQVQSSERDDVGEKVAGAVAQAIAQKNAVGHHNLDLVGDADTPLRIDLGSGLRQAVDALRQARREFPPLRDGGLGRTRVAAEPHGPTSGVQTFSPSAWAPSETAAGLLDDAVKRLMVKSGCVGCHTDRGRGGPRIFQADGQLLPGSSVPRLLQVLEGCGLSERGQMLPIARRFRESLEPSEKADLVAFARRAGFADFDPLPADPDAQRCSKWSRPRDTAPRDTPPRDTPPRDTPPSDGPAYAHALPPTDLDEAKERGIFTDAQLVKPEDVAERVKPENVDSNPPLILNIGTEPLIRGATPVGDLRNWNGPEHVLLKQALQTRRPGQELIIYCGCCSFDACPPLMSALHELAKLGVRDAKVIQFNSSLPIEWEEKGFPMAGD